MAKSLGKLKRFNLQEYWGDEFGKFSTWLGQEEILEMIGESVGVELGRTGDKEPVLALKGGIVVRNIKTDDIVLIQGQLGSIHYDDVGKLIAVASDVDATMIIWIASKIPEDHQKALDWLNHISRNDVSFYGAELELWRIDDSAPAPNLSIVCRPNQWLRSLDDEDDTADMADQGNAELDIPQSKQELPSQRKGDWSKKPTQQQKSSAQSKDDISIRENFVYTKSF